MQQLTTFRHFASLGPSAVAEILVQPVVVLCTKTMLSGLDPKNSLTASLFSRHILLHRSRNQKSGCFSCSSINLQKNVIDEHNDNVSDVIRVLLKSVRLTVSP